MYLVFDTETTGFEPTARAVSIAWTILDSKFQKIDAHYFILEPDDFEVPERTIKIHGITPHIMKQKGVSRVLVFRHFLGDLQVCKHLVGHNVMFDFNIVRNELEAAGINLNYLMNIDCICTMEESRDFCQLPNPKQSGYLFKRPKLQELYAKLFGTGFEGGHNAAKDVEVTAKCFVELFNQKVIPKSNFIV